MGIGRAWASDAVLTRIDVGRVSATGVVDLGGEAGSGYRFVSPGRRQRWINDGRWREAADSDRPDARDQGDAGARPVPRGTYPGIAPPPASLPLAEILERARRGRGFEDKPYYAGYLIHLPREGWVWYFRAVSGHHRLPAPPRQRRPHLSVSLTVRGRLTYLRLMNSRRMYQKSNATDAKSSSAAPTARSSG